MDLEKLIRNNKPNASDVSIKTYIANLHILHKLINGHREIKNLDFLKNYDKVLDALNQKAKSTLKNYLVAVVVAIQNHKDFEKVLEKYNNKIKNLQENIMDNYENQEKSKQQNENWLDYNDILKLLKTLKKDTKPYLEADPNKLTNKQKILIQQYLLLYLYSGVAFPVIRNDFAEMKVLSKDTKTDPDKNYLILNKSKSYFKLNEYKTKKYSGEKIIEFKDRVLKKLIKDWLDITNSDYLLINVKDNTPMTANGITKNLNSLFENYKGKTVSTSLLRSIYISHKYNDTNMTLKEKKELGKDMLHSKSTAETIYHKLD